MLSVAFAVVDATPASRLSDNIKGIYVVHDLFVSTPQMHRVLSDRSRTSVGLESELSRTKVGGGEVRYTRLIRL